MLVDKCYVKDIRIYEEGSNSNLLDLFDVVSYYNLGVLVSVFRHVDIESAFQFIDYETEQSDVSLIEMFDSIKKAIFIYSDEEVQQVEDVDSNGVDDIRQFNTLTDYYMDVCMQMISLGLTYSEFWGLSTKEIYSLSTALNKKAVDDFNSKLQIAYTEAALFGGAVWGRLPKDAPKIDINEINKTEIIETDYGPMSRQDYNSLKVLSALQ